MVGVARGHQRADTLKPYSQKTNHSLVKLKETKPCPRGNPRWVGHKGNGKPLQYSCLENPMNSMKRQNDGILKEELPRSVGSQYATGDWWRNNSRKNEGMGQKRKQYLVVDVTGDRSKV